MNHDVKIKAMFQDLYQTLHCIELECDDGYAPCIQIVRDEIATLEWLLEGETS